MTTTVTLNSAASVTDVKAGGVSIGSENFGFDGNTLTITKEYLAAQAVGELALTVEFDVGDPAALTISGRETIRLARCNRYRRACCRSCADMAQRLIQRV